MRGIIFGSIGLLIGLATIVAQATGHYRGEGGNGYLVGVLLLVFSVFRIARGVKQG